MNAAAPPERAGHGRHHRLVTVVADAHSDAPAEIDPLDAFEKAMHEMLPRLLAVGNNIDAGVLLKLQRDQGRVALALLKALALEPPRRPQDAGLGEPRRLRQAAGDGGFQHAIPPAICRHSSRAASRASRSVVLADARLRASAASS